MLVLTRYVDESIDIGDNVKVTILGIEPSGRIRVGIEAPRDVTIIRSEIVGTDRDRPRPTWDGLPRPSASAEAQS
jgi:carbon storage regulator